MSSKNLIIRTSSELKSIKSMFDARELAIGISEPEQKGDYRCYARRSNPNCHILIVDQSEKTEEEAQAMNDIINEFIQNTIMSCRRGDGIRDYEYIYLISHHDSSISILNNGAVSNWNDKFINIEKYETQEEMPWGETIKSVTTKKIWIKPMASGEPSLNIALEKAFGIAKEQIKLFPQSFPPIIYNISTINQSISLHDEESIYKIKGLKNEIGNVLFVNVNICKRNEKLRLKTINCEYKSKLASFLVRDLRTTRLGFYTSYQEKKILDIRMNLFNEMINVINHGSVFAISDEESYQMKLIKKEYEY